MGPPVRHSDFLGVREKDEITRRPFSDLRDLSIITSEDPASGCPDFDSGESVSCPRTHCVVSIYSTNTVEFGRFTRLPLSEKNRDNEDAVYGRNREYIC